MNEGEACYLRVEKAAGFPYTFRRSPVVDKGLLVGNGGLEAVAVQSFHDPQGKAGCVTHKLIGNAPAKKQFHSTRALTAHHDGLVTSGTGFVKNRMSDIIFVPEP